MVEQCCRDSSTSREVIYCGDSDVPSGMHGYEGPLADADPVPDALRAEGLASSGGTYLHCAPMFHLADMGLAMAHWIEGNTHSIARSEPSPTAHRQSPKP